MLRGSENVLVCPPRLSLLGVSTPTQKKMSHIKYISLDKCNHLNKITDWNVFFSPAEQLLSAKNSIVYFQFVACFIIVHRVGACLGR